MVNLDEEHKEEYTKKFMKELGMKGKATRIKVMKIIDIVGYNKKKIRTMLMRADIAEKIQHSEE